MASVATAHYPQSAHRQPQQQQSHSRSGASRSRHSDVYDRYYGHREVSEMCENVITALFACPLDSASSSVNAPAPNSQRNPTPRLSEFIAYALHRTRLPEEITYQALFLLRRLKSRFPAARGSSGHRLFISALMLASKSSCDDTYSNKSWTVVSQGLFTLREVNQMERELFGYLGFKVNVEMEELSYFRTLLLTGDVHAVVDCVNSPQSSPNPAVETTPSTQSPSLDRGCETPTASTQRSRGAVSVDSAPIISRRQSSVVAAAASAAPLRSMRGSSISSYPGDVHSTVTAAASALAAGYTPSSVGGMDSPYTRHPYQAAVATGASYSGHHDSSVSPSSASVSSSRGSISSASGYSMTPSPSSLSHSEASSIRTTPDTPPSELCGSPYTNGDVKSSHYGGEPAGTFDDNQYYLHHSQDHNDFVIPSKHQHIYSMVDQTRSHHPFQA